MSVRSRVIRDTAAIFFGLVLLVALVLWGAWEVNFGIDRQKFIRTVAVLVLVAFLLFTALFLELVWEERTIHYTGGQTSRLHLPLIVSTGALMVYFGLASIDAIDIWYEPNKRWPLMRDPTAQLFAATVILVVVAAKGWLLWEIVPPDHWLRRTVSRRRSSPGRS